ncbi:putative histidinol-phosphatase [Kockovaella imperatae]|uniref:Histidinol-phosphatase n=1 Tax=Kockovaella imperatae TaxID=4999 RepID=A0A1Y1USG3_9TREE|nr:putative histidinol-phosphatase [Kockovaella imperatae]ORX40135.1 putative histidinol-phosphatase [Kockovaella imperatae]
MPHSHHSHSGQFCRHAKDNLEQIVQEAISQGFELYGLSEHVPRCRTEDLYPEESGLTPEDLDQTFASFLREATALKGTYAAQITLLTGMESEHITSLDLEKVQSLIEDPRIDYIVGSVHHVHGIPIDFDKATWQRAISESYKRTHGTPLYQEDQTPASGAQVALFLPFLHAYFDAQFQMLQGLQPEVVGHFDLCSLYTPGISLCSLEPALRSKIERNVRYVTDYGGLFEANSAALRKGWTSSYPSEDVLGLIVSHGGKICLSDDSHGVAQVGLNYALMREYLVSKGVDTIWHLVSVDRAEHGDERVGNRGRVLARPVPGWQMGSFWRD